MVSPRLTKYRYRVDHHDRIVWLGPKWLAFARENGARDLTAELVVGRSLWEFIEDRETCEMYRVVHERVRSSGKTAIIPFRCDSPRLKRSMRMTISREEAGQLLYETVLVRVESRSPLAMLDPGQPRNASTWLICSCCLRTRCEPGVWQDIEEAAVAQGVFEQEHVPGLRYTICPRCTQALVHDPENGSAA